MMADESKHVITDWDNLKVIPPENPIEFLESIMKDLRQAQTVLVSTKRFREELHDLWGKFSEFWGLAVTVVCLDEIVPEQRKRAQELLGLK